MVFEDIANVVQQSMKARQHICVKMLLAVKVAGPYITSVKRQVCLRAVHKID